MCSPTASRGLEGHHQQWKVANSSWQGQIPTARNCSLFSGSYPELLLVYTSQPPLNSSTIPKCMIHSTFRWKPSAYSDLLSFQYPCILSCILSTSHYWKYTQNSSDSWQEQPLHRTGSCASFVAALLWFSYPGLCNMQDLGKLIVIQHQFLFRW